MWSGRTNKKTTTPTWSNNTNAKNNNTNAKQPTLMCVNTEHKQNKKKKKQTKTTNKVEKKKSSCSFYNCSPKPNPKQHLHLPS